MLLTLPAQEPEQLAKLYPNVDTHCSATRQKDKEDWLAQCRVFIWRLDTRGEREGITLFDLPLVQSRPATRKEALKAIDDFMEKKVPILLERVGFKRGKK